MTRVLFPFRVHALCGSTSRTSPCPIPRVRPHACPWHTAIQSSRSHGAPLHERSRRRPSTCPRSSPLLRHPRCPSVVRLGPRSARPADSCRFSACAMHAPGCGRVSHAHRLGEETTDGYRFAGERRLAHGMRHTPHPHAQVVERDIVGIPAAEGIERLRHCRISPRYAMQVCSLSPRLERRYSMNCSISTCASMAPSIS